MGDPENLVMELGVESKEREMNNTDQQAKRNSL